MTQLVKGGKDSKEEAVRVLRLPDGSRIEVVARLCDCTCRDGHVQIEIAITSPRKDLAAQHEAQAQEQERQLEKPAAVLPQRREWTWRFLYGLDAPPCLGHFEVGYWEDCQWCSQFTFLILPAAQARVKELNEQEAQ